MYLAGVAEFFFYGCRGGRLDEFPKPRPGIRKSPRRHLDTERFQGVKDAIGLPRIHTQTS
jgi:hypothetical protein